MPEEAEHWSQTKRVKRIGERVATGLRRLREAGVPLNDEAINAFQRKIENEELNIKAFPGKEALKEGEGTKVKGLYTRVQGEDRLYFPDLSATDDLTIMHEMVHAFRKGESEKDPFSEELPTSVDESATNWLTYEIAKVEGYDEDVLRDHEEVQVYPAKNMSSTMKDYEEKLNKIMEQRKEGREINESLLNEVLEPEDNNIRKDLREMAENLETGEVDKRMGRMLQGIKKGNLRRTMKALENRKALRTISHPFFRKTMKSMARSYWPENRPYYFKDVSETIDDVLDGYLDLEPWDLKEIASKMENLQEMDEEELEGVASRLENVRKINNHVLGEEDEKVRIGGLKSLLQNHDELGKLNENDLEHISDKLDDETVKDLKKIWEKGLDEEGIESIKEYKQNAMKKANVTEEEEKRIMQHWHQTGRVEMGPEEALKEIEPKVREETGRELEDTFEETRAPLPGETDPFRFLAGLKDFHEREEEPLEKEREPVGPAEQAREEGYAETGEFGTGEEIEDEEEDFV